MTTEKVLLALAGSEVCGVSVNRQLVQEVSLEELFRLAKNQDIAHLAGAALEKRGLLGTDEVSRQFQKQAVAAVYRQARMDRELQRICKTLSEAGIRHIPLKGSVLRAWYPEPWMRTSCDIDILVMEDTLDNAVAVLQEGLGYTREGGDAHEVSLFSQNGVHLELHFDLIEESLRNSSARILQEVWQEASPIQAEGMTLAMSDEMFYFYHIAHMAKHFQLGGCGIRSFLDVWVLNYRASHDRSARTALLEKGGLLEFALASEKLARVWFAGEQPDQRCTQMTQYLFRGGLYGDSQTIVSLRHAERGGKLGYILSRVFLPMDQLQMEYPVLTKKKWLYPFCQVARWFKLLFGGEAGYWLKRLRRNASSGSENADANARLLKDLGL